MATEKRLIDAVPYKEFLHQYAKDLTEMDAPMIAGAIGRCLSKLNEQSTVDAVEVVRCKDCKYCYCTSSEYGAFHCINTEGLYTSVYADDFCSYGERKDNGKS